MPRYGPRSESETLVEELADTVERPTPKTLKANEWIRPSTWALIKRKAGLERESRLHQRVRRQLVLEIKASLKDDRRHRTKAVGKKITGLLEAGELAEAWSNLKG